MIGLIVTVLAPFIIHPVIRTMEPQVVHYGMDFGGLNQAERDVALAGAAIAFASWEKDNTGLVFQEDGSGMKIMFVEWLSIIGFITMSQTNGIALCPFWENSENRCLVLISSDTVRVSQDAWYNERHTACIIAHEIGHVLEFMHTDTDNHLMNGPGGWVFDHTDELEHAFVIPEPRSLFD